MADTGGTPMDETKLWKLDRWLHLHADSVYWLWRPVCDALERRLEANDGR